MKKLIIICLLVSAAFTNAAEKVSIYQARITYYSAYEGDGWGDKVACQKTKRATRGVTVAAHPDFKFGTTIKIPQLANHFGDPYFVVQDRGAAVTKKKASKGNKYVFDVYVSSNKKIKTLARKYPMYMTVVVYHK